MNWYESKISTTSKEVNELYITFSFFKQVTQKQTAPQLNFPIFLFKNHQQEGRGALLSPPLSK